MVDKRVIKDNIKELSSITDELSSADIKKLNKVIYDIDLTNNADDMWKSIQSFDDVFSDAVKQATKESAPTTRKLHDLWMRTRTVMRDGMDAAVAKS